MKMNNKIKAFLLKFLTHKKAISFDIKKSNSVSLIENSPEHAPRRSLL